MHIITRPYHPPTVAAFDQTYTDQQLTALVDRAIAIGNVAKARREANAGTLPGDIPAFPVSYAYAVQLVRDEQERRHGPKPGSKAQQPTIETMTKRLLKLEDRALAKIEKEARGKERDARKTLAVARNLAAIATIEGKREGKAPNGQGQTKTKQDSLLERLSKATAHEGQERPLPTEEEEEQHHSGDGPQDTDTGHEEAAPQHRAAALAATT